MEREPKAERKGRSAAEVCTSEARKIGDTPCAARSGQSPLASGSGLGSRKRVSAVRVEGGCCGQEQARRGGWRKTPCGCRQARKLPPSSPDCSSVWNRARRNQIGQDARNVVSRTSRRTDLFRNHAPDCVCTYGLLVITLTAAAWITHLADPKTSFEHFSGSIGGFSGGWENLEQ